MTEKIINTIQLIKLQTDQSGKERKTNDQSQEREQRPRHRFLQILKGPRGNTMNSLCQKIWQVRWTEQLLVKTNSSQEQITRIALCGQFPPHQLQTRVGFNAQCYQIVLEESHSFTENVREHVTDNCMNPTLPDRDVTRTKHKLQANIPHEYRCKNCEQLSSKSNS